ncbi:MAG TPA: hypothetical protein VGG68_13435 [Caulobacteraceae bacterium]|jgi:uncharacterized membrane protein
MDKTVRQRGLTGPGHLVFALTLVGLGIIGLFRHGSIPIWNPIPKWAPYHDQLPWLFLAITLVGGAGLLWRRTAALASRLLLAAFLVAWLAFRVRAAVMTPTTVVYWENVGEATTYVAAAWTLYACFGDDWDRRIGFAVDDSGLRIARALFGLAMVAFGFAHLAYVSYTASLVPKWLPGHEGWVIFTGWGYILAGVGILTSVAARLAATLVAWQIFGFTLLVWAPQVWAGSKDPSVWGETLVSWTLTACAWVVAESYRGARWLGEFPADDRA